MATTGSTTMSRSTSVRSINTGGSMADNTRSKTSVASMATTGSTTTSRSTPVRSINTGGSMADTTRSKTSVAPMATTGLTTMSGSTPVRSISTGGSIGSAAVSTTTGKSMITQTSSTSRGNLATGGGSSSTGRSTADARGTTIESRSMGTRRSTINEGSMATGVVSRSTTASRTASIVESTKHGDGASTTHISASSAAQQTISREGTTQTEPATIHSTETTLEKTTPEPERIVILVFVIIFPFNDALTNPTSVEFINLQREVIFMYDFIFRTSSPGVYIRTVVTAFRPAAGGATRAVNTEAQVEVVFNNSAPASAIPTSDMVREAFVEAVTNSNNTFNLSVDAESIRIVNKTTVVSTTAIASSNTVVTTSNAAHGATTKKATTKAATTTAVTESLTTKVVTFRSVGEIFTSELLNPSSAAFTQRASTIKTMLEPRYETITSFRSLVVVSFRNGSIINTMNLRFLASSVPSDREIAQVLIDAASSITAFNIEPTSISVDGTLICGGVLHNVSRFTAAILVLVSWKLSSQ
ncbi:uncharacterized protein ACB058_002351 [Synchiropus picturatus]